MRERRRLDLTDRADGQSLLIQATPLPVFRGNEPDGFDYICGGCGQMVLAENVIAGTIFDAVFQCHACQALNAAPARPVWQPLPARISGYVGCGEKLADHTEEIAGGHVVISERATRAYRAASGSPPKEPTIISNGVRQSTEQ